MDTEILIDTEILWILKNINSIISKANRYQQYHERSEQVSIASKAKRTSINSITNEVSEHQ